MNQYIPHFIALLAGGLVAYATGSYIFVMLEGERISWRVKIAVVVFVMAGSSGLIAFLFRELAFEIVMFYALGFTFMLVLFSMGGRSPGGDR